MTVAQIAELEQIELKAGTHASADDGMCVMEAAAYFAGEPFSDHPQCVSPVIGAFLRSWNDSLDDSSRQRLKAYVFRVMGTNTGASNEEQRAWLAIDWLVRTYAPTWFDLAGLKEQAQETIEAARRAVWAAGAAAEAAAEAVAEDAAEDAARDAAWDAAWAAARAAAMDAAMDAGRDALQPTVEALQTSAFELLDRMIAVGNDARKITER